ncbi:MAG: copper amine oxidase N-terminal domain-containing protein [Firmicutes bacterium]|nr:copper amine oxidase N-terminal domain-containing protein [Bacillota bacterium]
MRIKKSIALVVLTAMALSMLSTGVSGAITTTDPADTSLIFKDDFKGGDGIKYSIETANSALPVPSGGVSNIYSFIGPLMMNKDGAPAPASYTYKGSGINVVGTSNQGNGTHVYNAMILNKEYMKGKPSGYVTETRFKFNAGGGTAPQKKINIFGRFGEDYKESYYIQIPFSATGAASSELALYSIGKADSAAVPYIVSSDTSTNLLSNKVYLAKLAVADVGNDSVAISFDLYLDSAPDKSIGHLEHTFSGDILTAAGAAYGPGFGIANGNVSVDFLSFAVKSINPSDAIKATSSDFPPTNFSVSTTAPAPADTVKPQEPTAPQPPIGEKPIVTPLAPETISVRLDGETLSFDQPPIILNGRTLVPMRAIFEKLGAAIEWNEDTQSVTAKSDSKTIVLTIDSSIAAIDGEDVVLDQPPVILNERTLVPVRFVGESLNCNVDWNEADLTVIITSRNNQKKAELFDEKLRQASGVYNWGLDIKGISKETHPELKGYSIVVRWNKLEPSQGAYEFEERIGKYLKEAAETGIYATLKVWVGPDIPEWAYDYGVPRVETEASITPLGTSRNSIFPYYFSSEYKELFFKLIDEMGAYVSSLAPEVRERLLFVQSAEGSTGDGQCYKSAPIDPQYDISKEEWNKFRQEVWAYYKKSFPGVAILVNGDANSDEGNQWLIDNMDVFALKQGMYSHGYLVSESIPLKEKWDGWYAKAENAGKPFLSRGESDGEITTYAWASENVPQALYWSGIYGLHNRLDVWNIQRQVFLEYPDAYAYTFFNKYTGFHRASAASGAFCALADRLDAADFERFPAEIFGGEPGVKNDQTRYIRIAKAFEEYGAKQEDPATAIGGRMLNRRAQGVNDVGWDILSENYYRYLEQINPGEGDVGVWNVDDSIYGRFGRSFENSSGKTFMKFKLDSGFFADNTSAQKVRLTVTWLDRGTGAWALEYAGQNGVSEAFTMANTDSGEWKTEEVSLTDAMFNGQLDGGDLLLKYISGDDTIFHMVEVIRM